MAKFFIPLQPCTSSQLQAFGYDAASKTLAIRFHPTKKDKAADKAGGLYTYSNVAPEVFDEFQQAESKGKFFGERIKGHADRYPFARVNEDEAEEKTS